MNFNIPISSPLFGRWLYSLLLISSLEWLATPSVMALPTQVQQAETDLLDGIIYLDVFHIGPTTDPAFISFEAIGNSQITVSGKKLYDCDKILAARQSFLNILNQGGLTSDDRSTIEQRVLDTYYRIAQAALIFGDNKLVKATDRTFIYYEAVQSQGGENTFWKTANTPIDIIQREIQLIQDALAQYNAGINTLIVAQREQSLNYQHHEANRSLLCYADDVVTGSLHQDRAEPFADYILWAQLAQHRMEAYQILAELLYRRDYPRIAKYYIQDPAYLDDTTISPPLIGEPEALQRMREATLVSHVDLLMLNSVFMAAGGEPSPLFDQYRGLLKASQQEIANLQNRLLSGLNPLGLDRGYVPFPVYTMTGPMDKDDNNFSEIYKQLNGQGSYYSLAKSAFQQFDLANSRYHDTFSNFQSEMRNLDKYDDEIEAIWGGPTSQPPTESGRLYEAQANARAAQDRIEEIRAQQAKLLEDAKAEEERFRQISEISEQIVTLRLQTGETLAGIAREEEEEKRRKQEADMWLSAGKFILGGITDNPEMAISGWLGVAEGMINEGLTQGGYEEKRERARAYENAQLEILSNKKEAVNSAHIVQGYIREIRRLDTSLVTEYENTQAAISRVKQLLFAMQQLQQNKEIDIAWKNTLDQAFRNPNVRLLRNRLSYEADRVLTRALREAYFLGLAYEYEYNERYVNLTGKFKRLDDIFLVRHVDQLDQFITEINTQFLNKATFFGNYPETASAKLFSLRSRVAYNMREVVDFDSQGWPIYNTPTDAEFNKFIRNHLVNSPNDDPIHPYGYKMLDLPFTVSVAYENPSQSPEGNPIFGFKQYNQKLVYVQLNFIGRSLTNNLLGDQAALDDKVQLIHGNQMILRTADAQPITADKLATWDLRPRPEALGLSPTETDERGLATLRPLINTKRDIPIIGNDEAMSIRFRGRSVAGNYRIRIDEAETGKINWDNLLDIQFLFTYQYRSLP